MNAKQLKASIRPRKRFNINLRTGVIARMNRILGNVTNYLLLLYFSET